MRPLKKWLKGLRHNLAGSPPPASPFAAEAKLIVHCSHHKMGTVWFANLLRAVAVSFGLPYTSVNLHTRRVTVERGILLQTHGHIGPAELPDFIGSHMIRDLRDVVVSGYFYHLRTAEEWAHVPDPRYGNRSYQQHLSGLDRHAGLLAEIDHFAASPNFPVLASWDFHDSRFLNLRYEDMVADEAGGFQRLFRHYGFRAAAVEQAVEIALQFSAGKLPIERTSQESWARHIRSGRPGEWRDVFHPEHTQRFKERLGDLLIRLGYEHDHAW